MIVRQLILKLSANHFPAQTILNVNVPDLPLNEIKGLEVTRLGKRHCAESIVKEYDPRGRPIYWIGPPGQEADAGPGTDFFAISRVRLASFRLRSPVDRESNEMVKSSL